MRKKLLPISFLLLGWLLSSCTTSPRITAILTAPSDSVFSAQKYNVAELEQKYPKQPYVDLLSKRTFEHSAMINQGHFEDWKFHTIVIERYVILNPDNTDASTVTFHASKESQLNSIYTLYKSPSGKITRFARNNFSSTTDEAGMVKYVLNIPATEKGALVEQACDFTVSGLSKDSRMEFNFNLQREHPIENLEMNFLFPEWWNIQVKNNVPYEKLPIVEKTDDDHNKRIITYKANMLPAVRLEAFAPFYRANSPYIELHSRSIMSKEPEKSLS